MLCSYTPNKSLRLKIENACNLKCSFCHAEGNCNADRMTVDQVNGILDFSDQYGYSKIHLTGGEPTLHPDVDAIVLACISRKKTCAITSNGQCKPSTIEKLINAGLQSINFSFPTIDPLNWSQLQDNTSLEVSRHQIANVISSIDYSVQRGLRTKINIVIGSSPIEAVDVIDNFAGSPVELRLLNALGNEMALTSIDTVLAHYSAQLVDEIATMGSSQVKRIFDSSIGRLVVKAIRPYRQASVCQNCNQKCNEGIYGIRLESSNNLVFARFCIQNSGGQSIKKLVDLPNTEQFCALYRESGISMNDQKEMF